MKNVYKKVKIILFLWKMTGNELFCYLKMIYNLTGLFFKLEKTKYSLVKTSTYVG